MLSRIASSMYWMARLLERADNTARLLDINVLYMHEADGGQTEQAQWEPLLSIVRADQGYAETFPDGEVKGKRVIQYLCQDKSYPGSLFNSLRLARENARVVRDTISNEMWEAINEFWLRTERHLKTPLAPWNAAEFFSYARNEVARFQGLTVSTMMRGEPFGYSLLGTFLERADMTARILDVKYHLLLPDLTMVGSPLDFYQWGALLKSLSGFESYRRLYHTGIRPIDVTEFVVCNADYPRSLRFALDRMAQAMEQIGREPGDREVSRCMEALSAHVDGVSPKTIVDQGLHEYLQELLVHLSELNMALQRDSFEAHLGALECAT